MKFIRVLYTLVMVALAMTACTSSVPIEASSDGDTAAVVQGNTAFALDLYGKLKTEHGNLFLSPYSISTALAMTYAGARGDSEKQMANVLHFTPDNNQLHPSFALLEAQLNAIQGKGDIELSVANALWLQNDYAFFKSFLDLIEKNYGAVINRVNFRGASEAVRIKINRWVEEKTKDKIMDLIKPGVLDSLTRLVLTNAIYFKGNWASQFETSKTKEETFWLDSGNSISVPMMVQKKDFRYVESESLQILELPYTGNDLSMIVLLPRERDGLGKLEASLTVENLTNWLNLLKENEIRVFLPKFKMTSQFSLSQTLASMGMPDVFTSKADFSGMTDKKDLYISAVIHKAFVDVNEEGTEAAAATAVAMRFLSMPSPPPVFRADHPFLFLIRHHSSESILFLGRVVNPMT